MLKEYSAFIPLETKGRQKSNLMSLTGFTLVELIIIVAIVAVIAIAALVRYGPVAESARRAEAYSVLNEIVSAEKRYYVENSIYTTDITALDSFSSVPSSDNFTFSVPSAVSSSGYAQAARKNSASGRKSYGMCLDSGRRADCSADTCNPTCS